MNVRFNIFSIKANGLEGSSALNVGTNILIGFLSNTKSTEGQGEVKGDFGLIPSLNSAVDDRDLVDTPNWEAGGPWGARGSPAP